MEIEWLEDSRIIFTDISRQDQNEYLDTLYQIGNGNENNSSVILLFNTAICLA